jgi:catechol 2,3-dioxygenase-like lactoylglutathione lyase family enzyme
MRLSPPMSRPKVEFIYSGIRVRNLTKSLRFYRTLGFRIFRRGTMEHGGKWVHLRFPGAVHRLELNYYPPGTRFYEPMRKGTEFDHFGFRVSNVEAWTRQLRRWRVPIVAVVQETHENLVYTRDPDGNWVEFFGPVVPTKPTD